MLSKHAYYIYHEGQNVHARMGERERVLVEKCKTPEAAFEKVQSIINPTGRTADSFAEVDKLGRQLGYLSAEFQNAISKNCEKFVKAAYGLKA